MENSQTLPELVREALAKATASQDRVSQILTSADGRPLSADQAKELAEQTIAIEQGAVDIFAVFEARMQHHFRRGPFSRKLKAALLASGNPDLADRVHQHYLAINVLKHGIGASFRELANNKSQLIVVKPVPEEPVNDAEVSTGLIDVTVPQFFERLTDAILESYQYLEGK